MGKFYFIATVAAAVVIVGCWSTFTPSTAFGESASSKAMSAPTNVKIGKIKESKSGYKGEVLSFIKIKDYIYIEFKTKKDRKKLWVATSPVEISVGDQIEIPSASVMKDFYGREINTKFDYILFAPEVKKDAVSAKSVSKNKSDKTK